MVFYAAVPLLVAISQSVAAPTVIDVYAGRDGEAEALADISTGRPAKVYIRGTCGDRCSLNGVGLLNCEPERFDTVSAPKGFFVHIPEADFSSSVIPTAEQHARGVSAYFFAKAYNLTTFRERKPEILKQCPRAEVGE